MLRCERLEGVAGSCWRRRAGLEGDAGVYGGGLSEGTSDDEAGVGAGIGEAWDNGAGIDSSVGVGEGERLSM